MGKLGTNYLRYKETHRIASYRWRQEHPARVRELKSRFYHRHRDRIRIERKDKDRMYKVRLKMKVFEHYGGVPPKCACCGETHVHFLSLDHIEGGGGAHFKKLHGSNGVYRWLVRGSFPVGYQILCMNCNFAKGKFGRCPHTIAQN